MPMIISAMLVCSKKWSIFMFTFGVDWELFLKKHSLVAYFYPVSIINILV